jgi:hypothetical protein
MLLMSNHRTAIVMNAITKIGIDDSGDPVLEMLETPWGFRLRPAKIENKRLDALVEWSLTGLGALLILAAVAQWFLPSVASGGEVVAMKLMFSAVLAVAGGVLINVAARGFRPEVQVDRQRGEVRFVSRNPRGRGKIMAEVDLDRIIGVGMTRSIDGPDCHCLIYLIDGEKPLRLATATEPEIKKIRKRMDEFVVSPEDRAMRTTPA